MTTEPMTCPLCGTRMNHQASKLVHPVTEEEAAEVSEAFDGVLEDVFACPRCGRIEARRAAPPPARHR